MDEAKVVLLGDPGVGKSSLVLRFVHGRFDGDSPSTVGVSFVSKVVSRDDGLRVKFQIWDTAGQEAYHSLASLYYRGAHVALVVFDVTRAETFKGVKTWVHELSQLGPADVVMVVVANKTDLDPALRAVSRAEGEAYALQRGTLYIETSAKLDSNVTAIFDKVSEVLFHKGLMRVAIGDGAGPLETAAKSEVGPIKLDAVAPGRRSHQQQNKCCA
jgi:small GTP-binding protein